MKTAFKIALLLSAASLASPAFAWIKTTYINSVACCVEHGDAGGSISKLGACCSKKTVTEAESAGKAVKVVDAEGPPAKKR